MALRLPIALRCRLSMRILALLVVTTAAAGAQYSTLAGSGAAKPKTLRATAVLEWTGSLDKPSASRLMPLAVWDGEHYQPAALYLARPSPLAFDTGTLYELERGGQPAGLLDVRAAAQLRGGWIGLGKFKPEAPPPPPPRLKPSKQLPVLAGGKAARPDTAAAPTSDKPTLHRKDDAATTTPDKTGTASSPSTSSGPAASPAKPADTSTSTPADPDHPTLHRRTDAAGDTSGTGSSDSGASNTTAGTSPSSTNDPDRPTLHRPADTGSSDTTKSSASDDAPTLHRRSDGSSDAKTADSDPDRPTLHRARNPGVTAASIDPDRPHLRYGGAAETADAALPPRLNGRPADMQQIVAVSDAATGEQRPYQYHWASPDDAARMQSALAALAARAVAKPGAATPVQFGPASHAARPATRSGLHTNHILPPATSLVDEHFVAYELTFSGGATLIYSAHTAGEGSQRWYVTLIAQPDFNGTPQVLLQQVARGDRLDETPAMQLIDAVDTDDDNRAELVFQLNGAATMPPPENVAGANAASAPAEDGASSTATSSAASIEAAQAASTAAQASAAAVPEREFAIYRIADGKAVQVFTTGPLP